MLVRVITLRFNAVLGSFDDGPLRDFLKDKDVLSIRDHFFVKDEMPYLTVLVTYTPPQAERIALPEVPRRQPEASWRELVTPEELPLFNTLRDWRAERSKRDGVPPYVICTNRHCAAMVRARPQSLSQLADIEGFGKAKIDKYGQELLVLLAQAASPPQTADTPGTSRETLNG